MGLGRVGFGLVRRGKAGLNKGGEMTGKYILEGKVPKLVQDVMEWSRWFESADRQVARTKKGEVLVSTVFLGLDYSFDGGLPILYETMVFGGEFNYEQERYHTWEDAEEGHRQMVAKVFKEVSL